MLAFLFLQFCFLVSTLSIDALSPNDFISFTLYTKEAFVFPNGKSTFTLSPVPLTLDQQKKLPIQDKQKYFRIVYHKQVFPQVKQGQRSKAEWKEKDVILASEMEIPSFSLDKKDAAASFLLFEINEHPEIFDFYSLLTMNESLRKKIKKPQSGFLHSTSFQKS